LGAFIPIPGGRADGAELRGTDIPIPRRRAASIDFYPVDDDAAYAQYLHSAERIMIRLKL
jgi:hypothetical protein